MTSDKQSRPESFSSYYLPTFVWLDRGESHPSEVALSGCVALRFPEEVFTSGLMLSQVRIPAPWARLVWLSATELSTELGFNRRHLRWPRWKLDGSTQQIASSPFISRISQPCKILTSHKIRLDSYFQFSIVEPTDLVETACSSRFGLMIPRPLILLHSRGEDGLGQPLAITLMSFPKSKMSSNGSRALPKNGSDSCAERLVPWYTCGSIGVKINKATRSSRRG